MNVAMRKAYTLAELTGQGLETYIRPDGYCITFLDGKFYSPPSVAPLSGNTEDTIKFNCQCCKEDDMPVSVTGYIPLGLRTTEEIETELDKVVYVDFKRKLIFR